MSEVNKANHHQVDPRQSVEDEKQNDTRVEDNLVTKKRIRSIMYATCAKPLIISWSKPSQGCGNSRTILRMGMIHMIHEIIREIQSSGFTFAWMF